jgi:hypothetical protein
MWPKGEKSDGARSGGTVGKVLFHPILLQKVQTHFRSSKACVLGTGNQLSIGSTDLSFAPSQQFN